jgi:hypothetical protein
MGRPEVSSSQRGDQKTVENLLPMALGPDKNSIIAFGLLQRTPLDSLDQTIKALKKHRPTVEVRAAMIELLATAPISRFEPIKQLFVKHFGDAGK